MSAHFHAKFGLFTVDVQLDVPAFTCNDDRRQAAKLLYTNAGFFTSIFVWLAFF
jgi:hypothetical protein